MDQCSECGASLELRGNDFYCPVHGLQHRNTSNPSERSEELTRESIEVASKPELIDMCKIRELDTSGTKTDLRLRLLNFIETTKSPQPILGQGDAEKKIAAEGVPRAQSEEKPTEPKPQVISSERKDVETMPPETQPTTARVERTCPTCGRPMVFVSLYERYYCESCKTYAPEEKKVAAEPAYLRCPTCHGQLTFIPQYNRHYCYRCRTYAEGTARYPCPTCGRELTWIPQYRRHYCYYCRSYAPQQASAAATAATAAYPVPSKAQPATVTTAGRAETAPRQEIAAPSINLTVPLGLAGAGLALYLAYEIAFGLPTAFNADFGYDPSGLREIAFALRFLGFVFLSLGVLSGLLLLRGGKG